MSRKYNMPSNYTWNTITFKQDLDPNKFVDFKDAIQVSGIDYKNLDWNTYCWLTNDGILDNRYSVTYTISSSDPNVYDELNRIDAEFEKQKDKTSIAKAMLNKIGIKVK